MEDGQRRRRFRIADLRNGAGAFAQAHTDRSGSPADPTYRWTECEGQREGSGENHERRPVDWQSGTVASGQNTRTAWLDHQRGAGKRLVKAARKLDGVGPHAQTRTTRSRMAGEREQSPG